MKKVIAVVCIVNVILMGSMIALLKSNLEPEKRRIVVENNATDDSNYVQYLLGQGDYEETVRVQGECIEKEAVQTLELAVTEESDICLSISKGSDIEEGTVIAVIDDKEVKAQGNWKVLDYSVEKETIKIQYLNYARTSIAAMVPMDIFESLTYDTEVYLELGDEKSILSKINWMDWHVRDGKVEIHVDAVRPVLPGASVTVKFIKAVYPDVVTVRTEFIMEDNVGLYLYRNIPDAERPELLNLEKVYIKVLLSGEERSIIEIDGVDLNERFYAEKH